MGESFKDVRFDFEFLQGEVMKEEGKRGWLVAQDKGGKKGGRKGRGAEAGVGGICNCCEF